MRAKGVPRVGCALFRGGTLDCPVRFGGFARPVVGLLRARVATLMRARVATLMPSGREATGQVA